MRSRFLASTLLALACGSFVSADEAISTARPIPLTRDEMKRLLEELKGRTIRIPLPELTEADRAALGERADSYEARLRHHYLPVGEGSVFGGRPQPPAQPGAPPPPPRDFTRNADENMTLSYSFKTMLFWIVARTNNCQYCLGHQEQKLSAVGMTEEEIAALDFDWKRFKPAEQAAFAYARKITYSPHQIGDDDIAALRKHYTDSQILEMTLSTSGNNAINRWKEGAGIPQSKDGETFFRRATNLPKDRPVPDKSFLTPTAAEYSKSKSQVVPFVVDVTGNPTATSSRPALESREQVEAARAAARTRQPRLPLQSEEAVRAAWGPEVPEGRVPNWMRLMATFPNEGKNRLPSLMAMTAERGDLSLKTKAQVSWIVARLDRAWYAVGQAQAQLKKLGQTDDQIFALDGDWHEFTAEEQAIFRFARDLAMSPIALTDAEVTAALGTAGPRKVVQLVNFVTGRAYFDRVTEAAGLPLDD
jgi:alkylhydroperoxidase family enzyme